jgi:hypothetical protein
MFWTIVGAILFVVFMPLILYMAVIALYGIGYALIFIIPIGLTIGAVYFAITSLADDNVLREQVLDATAILFICSVAYLTYRDVRDAGGTKIWFQDFRIITNPAISSTAKVQKRVAIIQMKERRAINRQKREVYLVDKINKAIENKRLEYRNDAIKTLGKLQKEFSSYPQVSFDFESDIIKVMIDLSEIGKNKEIIRIETQESYGFPNNYKVGDSHYETAGQVRKHVKKAILDKLVIIQSEIRS